MKSIVIYYSLNQDTDYIARKIAKMTGADLLRLEAVKPFPTKGFMKYFVGGKSVMRKQKPELKPYTFDASKYDMIYLGSPVWAGKYASPISTFLDKEKLSGKNIKLFMCLAGTGSEKPLEVFEQALAGNQIAAKMSFQDPYTSKKTFDEKKLEQFCK